MFRPRIQLVQSLLGGENPGQAGFHAALVVLLGLSAVATLTPLVGVSSVPVSILIAAAAVVTFVGVPVGFAYRWRQTVADEAPPWLVREKLQHLWFALMGILLTFVGLKSPDTFDLLLVLTGLVFFGAAGHGGWRYSQGKLPVSASRTELPADPPPQVEALPDDLPPAANDEPSGPLSVLDPGGDQTSGPVRQNG